MRTLDEFFNRLIVVDRRVAVIPGKTGALAVREPMVVDYLVDVFERHWERARPYINRESKLMREVAAEQRAMTIRMLIEGHADPSSAKRLGVSPRTYAGYVADLKAEYDAETRFQLGYAMGRLGVSGQEDEDGAGPEPRRAAAEPATAALAPRRTPKSPRGQRRVSALGQLRRAGGMATGPHKGGGMRARPSQGIFSCVRKVCGAAGLLRLASWCREAWASPVSPRPRRGWPSRAMPLTAEDAGDQSDSCAPCEVHCW